MAKAELLSIFNESFSMGIVSGPKGSPVEKGRQTAYILFVKTTERIVHNRL